MDALQTPLRRRANACGGVLLLYVGALWLAELEPSGFSHLAAPIGLIYLLLKKRYPVWQRSNTPMTFGSLINLLILVLGTQLIAQLGTLWLPQTPAANEPSVALVLYVVLFAPIGEELLFRGLLQRCLEPYDKLTALLVQALLFGLLHGSWIQLPYGCLLGLVLGYTAMTYHLFWSIALHITSNLLFGYGLPALLSALPAQTQFWAFWGIILTFAVASLLILTAKSLNILSWLRNHRMRPGRCKAFFGAIPVLLFLLLSILRLVLN